jgi:chromosome segregation ATPase
MSDINKQISDMENTIISLQNEKMRLNDNIDIINSELNYTKKELEKQKNNLEIVKEEKNEIAIMNNSLIMEKTQLEEKYQQLLKEKENIDLKLSKLQLGDHLNINNESKNILHNNSNNDADNNELNKIKKENERIISEMDTFKKDVLRQIQELNSEIGKLKNENLKLKNENTKLKNDKDQKNIKIKDIEPAELEKLKIENLSLKQDNEKYINDIQKNVEDLVKVKNDMSIKNDKIAGYKRKVTKLETENKTQSEHILKINTQNELLMKTIKDKEDEIFNYKKEKNKLSTEKADIIVENAALKEKERNYEIQIETIENNHKESMKMQKANYEELLEKNRKEIQELKTKKNSNTIIIDLKKNCNEYISRFLKEITEIQYLVDKRLLSEILIKILDPNCDNCVKNSLLETISSIMCFSNEERFRLNLPPNKHEKIKESDNISYNRLLTIIMDFKIYLSKI